MFHWSARFFTYRNLEKNEGTNLKKQLGLMLGLAAGMNTGMSMQV